MSDYEYLGQRDAQLRQRGNLDLARPLNLND